MSYLTFNEGFMNTKKSFFIGKNIKKEKPVENKVKIKPIKTSIKRHIENQLPESGKHNPDPITPLKRNVLN